MTDSPEDSNEDDQVLAAEYTLGLLSQDEAADFEDRLATQPALRAAYAQWAGDLTRLTDDIAPVTPPARIKTAIDATLFGDERASSKPGLLQRFGLSGLIGAAVVAALLFILILPTANVPPPNNPVFAADLEASDGALKVHAGYDAETREMYVKRNAGDARDGRVLELWLIVGDAAPVSLGILPEDEAVRLPLTPDEINGLEGGVLALSDEPPGGSPTGAPTGDILATATLTRV